MYLNSDSVLMQIYLLYKKQLRMVNAVFLFKTNRIYSRCNVRN